MRHITPAAMHDHLSHEHHRSPFEHYLREIIYGGSDGIITTFAVVSGFSGAHIIPGSTLPLLSVLLFGFANLFADATSMGLGNYLSSTADQDVFHKERKKELSEIQRYPDFEYQEAVTILHNRGFSRQNAEHIAHLFKKNEAYWIDFMMYHGLRMQNPYQNSPALTALATFLSFVFFGTIPLLPYMFADGTVSNTFIQSIGFTFTSLFLLGIFRWRVTQQHLVRSVGETLLVGTLSSLVAYFVGSLFKIG